MNATPNSNDLPRVAVVGSGMWGINHARVFSELGCLAAICDRDPARLDMLKDRFASVRVSAALSDVLDDPDIAAVILATPAVTHASLATELLEAGKDVLVEKPMALDVSEAEALCDLADREGRVLAVGHVLEYHPAILKLRELVTSGGLGRVRYVYSNRLNFGRIRTEENVLWSFAPHDIAIMLRLLGSSPETITCHGGSFLRREVADTTLTSLTFPGDVHGHVYVSWLHPFKEQRFVVVGDQRMAVFDDTAPWPEKLMTYEHSVDWADGRVPVARKVSGEPVAVEEAEPLRCQAEAFLEAVVSRQGPLADARSGAAVLRVLMAAQSSLEHGGALVDVGGRSGTYVHPSASIDAGASIGAGTKIWHHVHVMSDVKIGRDCTLGQDVFVGQGVRIGDGCKIQNNVSVYDGVTLEDGVFCGPSVVFTNVRNPRSQVDRGGVYDATVVREGASLGANATIVCGNTIGRFAFVGAGTVVTHDVPDFAIVIGNPGRRVGWMCRCGERLPDGDAPVCEACGRAYQPDGEGLREA
jgi:UDP-2-acetamido-3-amino-2,3-dideoxy-glucuronate N-acetyltransferase